MDDAWLIEKTTLSEVDSKRQTWIEVFWIYLLMKLFSISFHLLRGR